MMEEADKLKNRSALRVTWDVWSALTLREFVGRTTEHRMAWFWMIFEPTIIIAAMSTVRFYMVSSMRHVVGAEYYSWLILGVLPALMFRDIIIQSLGSIDSSRSLFSYRQVLPIDTVIARCYVAGMLRIFVMLISITALSMVGVINWPWDLLQSIVALFCLFFLGLSCAVLFSAIGTLIPEVSRILRLCTIPLILVSGAVFTVSSMSFGAQKFMSWNPLFICVENIRFGFFKYYHSVPNLSLSYAFFCSLIILGLGLIMHIRFGYLFKRM